MLEVDPGQLPSVGGKLTMYYADLANAIVATQNAVKTALTHPMGADQTSLRAKAHFDEHQAQFYNNTHDGANKWLGGAHLIVPVSQDYAAVDGVGGGNVASSYVSQAMAGLKGRGIASTDGTTGQVEVTSVIPPIQNPHA